MHTPTKTQLRNFPVVALKKNCESTSGMGASREPACLTATFLMLQPWGSSVAQPLMEKC